MSIPGAASPLFLGAAVAEEAAFQIDRSLRITKGDQAYLNRTPSSAGNRKTFTLSFWMKRTIPVANFNPTTASVFGASAGGSSWFDIGFYTSDELQVITNAGVGDTGVRTQAVFRDFSSWYHFVVAVDTTNSTAADRIIIYVNGVRQAVNTPSGMPSQNSDTLVNATNAHYLGRDGRSSNVRYGDNYFAEINFVDGQALAPTDFGETDSDNNWNPKAFAGSYGTNGFRLTFADNSSNSALGDDSSGNNNDWTVNNLSVDDGTGTVYTDDLAASGSLYSGSSLSNAFDGNTGTSATMTNATQNQTLTFTPTGGIAYSSSVEVYLTPTGNVAVTRYSVNGGSDQSFSSGDGYKTILSGSGTLTSFVLKQGAQSNSVGFSAIRIDGSTILIDSNGANNDSLIDTPTNYEASSGNNGGNYATLNPLAKGTNVNLSNGNLETILASTSGDGISVSTIGISSGKWYWEVTAKDISGADGATEKRGNVGIVTDLGSFSLSNYLGFNASTWGYYSGSGVKSHNASNSSYGATYATGDVIGVAFDADNGTLTFYKNNVSQGTAFSGLSTSKVYFPASSCAYNGAFIFNFGQRSFAYTPPSNHLPLVTTNLPDPTIADGSTAFDAKTYSGTGSSNSITGLNFSPDFVWIKRRDTTSDHNLQDIIRGTTSPLYSNLTNAEGNFSQGLTAFNSDGFTVGTGGDVNNSSGTYVAWAWDGGTSTATNTDGSITSNVRANPSAGFSIVTYTVSAANQTVGHGLGVALAMSIAKRRNSTGGDWYARFKGGSFDGYLLLNSTAAGTSSANSFTSTTVPCAYLSTSNEEWVLYNFAPVAGYSAFGSYSGNGSSDGPFVYTGFKPAFLMFKRSDSTGDWIIFDNERNTHEGNYREKVLYPNKNTAEETSANGDTMLFLANGFKLNNVTFAYWNASGGTYVWAAFASHPFKTARAA